MFPDYKKFLADLKQKNLAVTLNLHPAMGVRYFEDAYVEMAKAMEIDPKTEQCVEFDITDERFINAYFEILHRPYEEDGVSFWWIDWQQGNESKIEGLKPLWALNHYHFMDHSFRTHPVDFVPLLRSWLTPLSGWFFRRYVCQLGNVALFTIFYCNGIESRLWMVES